MQIPVILKWRRGTKRTWMLLVTRLLLLVPLTRPLPAPRQVPASHHDATDHTRLLKYPDTCRASFVSGDGSQQSGTSAHICFYTV